MEDQKKNSLLDDDLSLEELAKNFDNIDINDLEKIQDLAKLQQQMNDFLIDRFATNIEAFKSTCLILASSLSTISQREPLNSSACQTAFLIYTFLIPMSFSTKQLILLNYANSRLYKFLKDQIFCKPATDMNPILTVSYI